MRIHTFCIALFSATLLASCGGEKHEEIAPGDVPPAVVTGFSAQYPGAADVKWEREEENGKILYEADFTFEGKKMDAHFDEAGTVVED